MSLLKQMLIILLMLLILTGCFGTVDWHESFRFKGTIEEINVEKKILVMKEYDAPESRKNGNIYEIPANNIEKYKVGEKLLIIVESNTFDDVWDLDHMRFEIKRVESK